MGGHVSTLAADLTDDQILQAAKAVEFKQENKALLVSSFRDAVKQTIDLKSSYGNGISVKGTLTNVSGKHTYEMDETRIEMGNQWGSQQSTAPANDVSYLRTSPFFHSHVKSETQGCRGGFVYKISEPDYSVAGYVSIAWENPYIGAFKYCIIVSKEKGYLQECLDHVNHQTDSTIIGKVQKTLADGALQDYITASVQKDDDSTCTFIVCIQTRDLVKEVLGDDL